MNNDIKNFSKNLTNPPNSCNFHNMKPEEKNESVESALTSIFGVDRKQSITNNICVICGNPATEFHDELSRREFSISGICSDCQNSVFD